MAGRRNPRRGTSYHVRSEFRAPRDFVFAWATDFAPDDARREKEDYARKIISRTARRVVYEDLVDSPKGWNWARHDVTLFPPVRWHSESVGSHRTASLDYVLTAVGPDRTRLDLRWRRWPTAIGSTIAKAVMERSTAQAWKNFGRELERDYRRSRRAHR
jgi:hypothetical protein